MAEWRHQPRDQGACALPGQPLREVQQRRQGNRQQTDRSENHTT